MIYNIHFLDSNKITIIESSNYEIKDNFVHFFVDMPGISKINIASFKTDYIFSIEMTNTIYKNNDRLKKLNSLNISKWQKFKNLIF
jgi:hypothetical protein